MSKVVLITGCSNGGLGFALANQFALDGCKVYATSRKLDSMTDFVDPLILTKAMDVGKEEDIRRTVSEILVAEGKIDILINNAGVIGISPLLDLSMDKIKDVFDTNTFSLLRMAQIVAPSMAEKKSGIIVNIGSVVGDMPPPWNGLYSASKAAFHALSDVLAMELQPFNIKVVLVKPGAVTSNIAKNAGEYKLPDDSLYTRFTGNILQRLNASQVGAMPTKEFSRKVAEAVLRKNPPAYIKLGGLTFAFKVFSWLPRTWVLWYLWRMYSKPMPVPQNTE